MKSIVVTGFGIASSIAYGAKEFEECMASGIWEKKYTLEELMKMAIEAFSEDTCRRIDEFTLFGLLATKEAFDSAQLKQAMVDPANLGTVFSTLWGPMQTINKYFYPILEKGTKQASPALFPYTVTNAALGTIARIFGCKGASSMLVGNCPLAYAYDLITNGKADIIVTGGIENVASLFAHYVPDYETANPFKGAAALVLEKEETAAARKAPILARIYGHSECFMPDLNNLQLLDKRLESMLSKTMVSFPVSKDKATALYTMFDGMDYTEQLGETEESVLSRFMTVPEPGLSRPFATSGQFLGTQSVMNMIASIISLSGKKPQEPQVVFSNSCRAGGNISSILAEVTGA